MTQTINGYELTDIAALLSTPEARNAIIARNLYIGDQLSETTKYLDGPYGIREWRERRYKPFCHNITQDIIDKSGLLFSDGVPTITVTKKSGKIDTTKSNDIFEYIEYDDLAETFAHIDRYNRLLKSSGLVFGFDAEENELTMDVVHAGNSFVVMDNCCKPDMLIRAISGDRIEVTTKDKIYIIEISGHTYSIAGVSDNVFGIIPFAVFHDSSPPVYGGPYNRVDTGLIDFNLSLNKQFTELNYSLEHIQRPTLFVSGASMPEGAIAGPGSIINLDSTVPGQAPTVEYKTPQVDVGAIQAILDAQIKQAASSYSVRIAEDSSVVTSGFSLIVKENANLELRKRRQRQFESGFKEAQEVIKTILAYVGFDLGDASITIGFPAPSLPINEMEQEQIWDMRISSGRATIKDYLMEVKKMTSEEADKKLVELEASKQVQAQTSQPTNIVGA